VLFGHRLIQNLQRSQDKTIVLTIAHPWRSNREEEGAAKRGKEPAQVEKYYL